MSLDTGDLSALLDPERSVELLRRGGVPAVACRRTYLRLKPEESALVGLEVDIEGRDGKISSHAAYARTFADDRARVVLDKWRSLGVVDLPTGEGVRLLPGGKTILAFFPNDARLRGLRLVADIGKLKHVLGELPVVGEGTRIYGSKKTRLSIVRYKPERRLVARAVLAMKNETSGEKRKVPVFLRFFPDARGAHLERLTRLLHDEEGEPFVPRPLGSLLEGRLYVEELVEGEELFAAVPGGRVDATRVAACIHRLHCARIPRLPVEENEELLATSETAARLLAVAEPRLSSRVDAVLDRLRCLLPGKTPRAPVHGDLHLHQMLVSEGRPTIIDLERVALSDPLRDVGNLLAHVIVVARRDLDQAAALLSFGEELSRVSLGLEGRPEGDLAFHVVRGLLEQAILPFRRIEDDWRTGCGELLDLALAQGGSGEERTPSSVSGGRASRVPPCTLDELDTRALRWEVLHPRNGTRWPGRFRDAEGEEVFGVLRRGEGRFQEIHPDEDPLLQPFPDLLQEAELVAYRSGRRATFRVKGEKGPARWVKIVSARRIADLVQRHETFRGVVAMRQPVPLSTARILEKDLERGRLTLSEVEGVPLHDHLLEGNRQREETSLAEVALALARLHEVSGPRVEGLTSSREHRSPSDWLALVAEHYPGLSPSWDEARHRLEPPSTAGHPVAVHGDLHDRNLLVHGSKVGILDLDSSGRGAREEDIGNLVAHLLLRSLQRDGSFEAGRGWTSCFLEAYRSAGSGLAEDALRGWLATALFRLSCVYLFRRRWRTLVPDLLAECERWSSRACSLP